MIMSQESVVWSHYDIDSLVRLSEESYKSSLTLPIWTGDNPTILSHILLTNVPASEKEPWDNIFSKFSQKGIAILHRGEFLSLLAQGRFTSEDSVKLLDAGPFTVQQIVDYERSIFIIDSTSFYNDKEKHYGQEYGWLLKAFSFYLRPNDLINNEVKVSDLARHIMHEGINRNFEEGCHDLEALAVYMQKLEENSQIDNDLKSEIKDYLKQTLEVELKHMTPEGQLYAYSSHFDGHLLRCQTNYCRTLDQLSRQAHFIEWVCDARLISDLPVMDLIVDRFHNLLLETAIEIRKRRAEPSNNELADILIVSALTHAVSAAHKLASGPAGQ